MQHHCFTCYNWPEIIPERGQGAKFYTQDKREIIDLAAGIAVSSLGHNHQGLVQTIQEQAAKLLHTSNLTANSPCLALAGYLTQNSFAERVFFFNSGSEANELAIKLAWLWSKKHMSGKTKILCFDGAFHGRSHLTSQISQEKYNWNTAFGHLSDVPLRVPLNDPSLLDDYAEQAAAIIVEPIQGEGGIIPLEKDFAMALRQAADTHNIPLIFDEVQSGNGRSGYLYCYQELGVVPDILTTAKGIGGGLPLSCVLTTDTYADLITAGSHGSTFGGNPVASAAALFVLQHINTPDFLTRVRNTGELAKKELDRLNAKEQFYTELRGRGLMLGCQLIPALAAKSSSIVPACLEEGVFVVLAGGGKVLRLVPPLIISPEEMTQALQAIHRALRGLLNPKK